MGADGFTGITPERTQGMMRKNQKGFTLVELIIAVAILAIVTLAVCGFIVVGSRSYTSANTDIMLQQEAQLALNQISDVIIDTTDSISYNVGVQGEELQPVLKDSEYAGEATDKSLVVVNRKDDTSNNDNASYWFYWSKDYEKIFFGEIEGIDAATTDAEIQNRFDNALDSLDPDSAAVLAEHVTNLSIDISQFEENRVVMISMSLENGNRTYSTSNNVTVRNRIALNTVNIDPMKRGDVFKLTTKTVTVEPGETGIDLFSLGKVDFDTSVSGLGLEWYIDPVHEGEGTSVSDGILKVGVNEKHSSFDITITPTDEKYAAKAQTMQVKVKRVTKVANENITAAPGDEVVLSNAAVTGSNLDIHCDGDDYDGSHDRLINPDSWTITQNPNNIASLVSKDNKNATVQISPTAKNGDVIIVEANSMRADETNEKKILPYGPVTGQWKITIEGEPEATVPSMGDLRYGSDNDGAIGMIYDHLYKGMSDFNRYVVCARLREKGNKNKDQDQVILYVNEGRNIRFSPDIFGADITKDYDVFLQLILPVDTALYKDIPNAAANKFQNGEKDDSRNNHKAIETEYFSHLDANGQYIGSKYESSAMFSGTIGQPVFSYSVAGTGAVYPSSNPADVVNCYLAGGDEIVVGAAEIVEDSTINLDLRNWEANGKINFSVYIGDDADINSWKLISGYDPETKTYRNHDGSYSSFADNVLRVFAQNNGFTALTSSNALVKRNNNQSGSWENARGTYHIVLGYWYACSRRPQNREYVFIATRNLRNGAEGDYNEHYYENRANALKIVVKSGLNLEVISSGEANWLTNFPVPTDGQFPFDLRSPVKQTATWKELKKYNGSEQYIGSLNNVKVECEYKPDSNRYEITLLYESVNGKKITTHSYGTYWCVYGSDKWECKTPGGAESTKEIVPNLPGFDGGESYFPIPTDADFPFTTNEQTIEQTLSVFTPWGAYWTKDVHITYTNTGGTHTIKIFIPHNEWWTENFGTWVWTGGSQGWSKQ